MTFKITNETCFYEAQKIDIKPVDKSQVPTGMFCSVGPSSELIYELWIVFSLHWDPRSSAVSMKPALPKESPYISVCPGRLSHRPFVACSRRNNPKMASTLLLRMRKLQQPAFLARSLNFRQIAGSVTHEDKKQNSRKEKRRRKREEGMRTHAMYHMKVKEIASEFRLKRLEEEKILNTEEQRKEDLRWQERKTHDGIIESINLENKLLQMQR